MAETRPDMPAQPSNKIFTVSGNRVAIVMDNRTFSVR